MALLRYFKKRDGLPDPKGSLSHTIPSRAISMANSEVTEAMTGDKKRGPYKKYSPEERCRMGRYACDRGVAAAARYFTRQFHRRDSLERSKLARTYPFFTHGTGSPLK